MGAEREAPHWMSWPIRQSDEPAPFRRTISIYRDGRRRYGICYGDLLPEGYHVRPTGVIDVAIPHESGSLGETFYFWLAAHNLFAVVSFCIRHGLARPPKAWEGILPKWVDDLFIFHEGGEIPDGGEYLTNLNFDYFRLARTRT